MLYVRLMYIQVLTERRPRLQSRQAKGFKSMAFYISLQPQLGTYLD